MRTAFPIRLARPSGMPPCVCKEVVIEIVTLELDWTHYVDFLFLLYAHTFFYAIEIVGQLLSGAALWHGRTSFAELSCA